MKGLVRTEEENNDQQLIMRPNAMKIDDGTRQAKILGQTDLLKQTLFNTPYRAVCVSYNVQALRNYFSTHPHWNFFFLRKYPTGETHRRILL